jgi:hypothetical protein
MNVITNLKDKRREKQMTYERKMLRELSLETLQNKSVTYFESLFSAEADRKSSLQEGCIDIAIEAFLLGAHFSRFGFYGESLLSVKKRCQREEKTLINALYDYLCFWSPLGQEELYHESIYYTCEKYVQTWWEEGFLKGAKRYRLRLR